jgi:hypothetical protein
MVIGLSIPTLAVKEFQLSPGGWRIYRRAPQILSLFTEHNPILLESYERKLRFKGTGFTLKRLIFTLAKCTNKTFAINMIKRFH